MPSPTPIFFSGTLFLYLGFCCSGKIWRQMKEEKKVRKKMEVCLTSLHVKMKKKKKKENVTTPTKQWRKENLLLWKRKKKMWRRWWIILKIVKQKKAGQLLVVLWKPSFLGEDTSFFFKTCHSNKVTWGKKKPSFCLFFFTSVHQATRLKMLL